MAYKPVRASTARIIQAKGAALTIVRPGSETKDPITGVAVGDSGSTFTTSAIGLPPGKTAERDIGSLVNRRLEEFHFGHDGSGTDVPVPGDIVQGWKGANWKLIWTSTLDPDGSGAVYTKAYGEA